jgi:excisionase family DNA binding protein
MSLPDASSRLLTIGEVAERLRLSRRTVERMVAAELLPAVRVGHRAIRVDEHELTVWIYGNDESPDAYPLTCPSSPAARAGATANASSGPASAQRAGRGATVRRYTQTSQE